MSISTHLAPSPATDQQNIKVMLVDDSVVIRGLLSRWLSEEDGIEVIASHRNGEYAVKDIVKADPDIVVLDIEMPVMDGMTALPQLLKLKPSVSVIMASTLTGRNAKISMEALALGAKDYIPKPSGNHGVTTSVEFRRELIAKVRALGDSGLRRAKTIARPTIAQPASPATEAPVAAATAGAEFSLRPVQRVRPQILAIGCSTGGPTALREFMTPELISAMRHVPIVLTQHMPATFTAILAEQLGAQTGLQSGEGIDGETLKPGHLYVAPGAKHMLLAGSGADTRIVLDDGPMVNFCKPAVDPLFSAVSKSFGTKVLAVILTGMGDDGARGAEIVANNGGNVLVQDEETSVVWGMPGATARRNICAAVLPLNELSKRTASILGGNFG